VQNLKKEMLAVLVKMSVLSGSACICNLAESYLTLPYLTKVNILGPNPARGSLDLAQPGVTILQPIITCCQFTNLKSYQNLVKYILGPLNLTCAEMLYDVTNFLNEKCYFLSFQFLLSKK